MRRATACASLALAVALGGCGGTHVTTAAVVTARSSPADLCFALKARLEGIEHTAAMNSPQPAALVGRLPAERVSHASSQAAAASRETASELARRGARPGSLSAMRAAAREYRRLARSLRSRSAASGSAGLRMQFAFLKIAGTELRGCLPLK